MNPTTVMVVYRAQPGQAEVALSAINSLVATVLAREPACLGIEILQDASDPGRITLIERWPSQQEFLGPHMQQPHIQVFIEQAGMFLAGPPDISFWRGRKFPP
jgi:quinol monooxygenase YgiN